jgi:membrane fusion protein (multidrug efflux system)
MNAPMAPISVKQRKPRTWLRVLLVLIVVGLLGALLFAAHNFKGTILKGVTAQIQSSVPTVATAAATSQMWQSSQGAVGSLRASNGANLSPEIGGVVDELHFESGQTVPAGFVLLHLRGNDDPAKLAQLQAAADIAAVNLRRDQRQLQVQGVAQSVVDSDAATLKQAQAQVAAQQAIMAEKIVRAPFAGKLGVRLVDLGQYLAAGTTIVTLQALDPMFIDFYLPQQALDTIKVGQKVSVAVDAYPGRAFDGEVLAINPLIDATSRMAAWSMWCWTARMRRASRRRPCGSNSSPPAIRAATRSASSRG